MTPLRAIPENAFVSGRHSIVAVPSVPGARYDLRIYALPESVTSTNVTIRVYDTQAPEISPEDQLVHARNGNLELPVVSLPPCFSPCDVPTNDLAPASLQIFNPFGLPVGSRFGVPQTFRVEIEPDSPDVRWWAVVSVMDRATRQVSLYQPSFLTAAQRAELAVLRILVLPSRAHDGRIPRMPLPRTLRLLQSAGPVAWIGTTS